MSAGRILIRLLPLFLRAAPVLFLFVVVLGAVHGLSYGVTTLMTQHFFDAVTHAIGSGAAPGGSIADVKTSGRSESAIQTVLWMGAALGAVTIGTQVLNGLHNFIFNVVATKISGHLSLRINRKSARLDPLAYEDPSTLDDINKANEGMNNSMYLVATFTLVVLFYVPYFAFMGIYLYRLKPVLALALVAIFVPVAINQWLLGSVFAKLEDESAPIRREYEYWERCMGDREYYKETRLLGAFTFFQELYRTALILLGTKIWRMESRTGLRTLGMKLITLAGYFCVLYMLFEAMLQGQISIGAFSAVFASIGLMFNIMEEMVNQHIGNMTRNIGTVRNFIRFLDLPERTGRDLPVDLGKGIVMEDVSFQYPGAGHPSLYHLSLGVKNGETLAVVGENGAGKTTLVRLLIGLYTPTEGSVRIGGVDTQEVSAEKVYQSVSAVFQHYQRYQMSLHDNIRIGEWEGDGEDERGRRKNGGRQQEDLHREVRAEHPSDGSRIPASLEKSGLQLASGTFPDGLDTMLSREFDGVDLSGGQWQRVAIARGFYRVHDIIVLDEPTAAIDPLEESRIYKKFAELSEQKTSIIVTHRLGSAKIADRIVVMERGHIAEIGTHAELMRAGGKYAEMFRAQAQWYEDRIPT